MIINSALVSAQNRKRAYWFNWEVKQPEDRNILLKDVLQNSCDVNSKRYKLSEKSLEYMSRETKDGRNHWEFGHHHDANNDKSHAITANMSKGVPYNVLLNPVRIETIENGAKNQSSYDSKQYRVYSSEYKSTTICGEGGGVGAKTGLYLCKTDNSNRNEFMYEVKDGKINVNQKLYPIRASDGIYEIRMLTPVECERLQTLPDDFTNYVSNTQRYRGIGNGWTAEVIIHILNGVLNNVDRSEKIVVLSMYDGIGTGRYCLDKMGFHNIEYYAYEIDKNAIKISKSNYNDIVQCGNAFDVRSDDWCLKRG